MNKPLLLAIAMPLFAAPLQASEPFNNNSFGASFGFGSANVEETGAKYSYGTFGVTGSYVPFAKWWALRATLNTANTSTEEVVGLNRIDTSSIGLGGAVFPVSNDQIQVGLSLDIVKLSVIRSYDFGGRKTVSSGSGATIGSSISYAASPKWMPMISFESTKVKTEKMNALRMVMTYKAHPDLGLMFGLLRETGETQSSTALTAGITAYF